MFDLDFPRAFNDLGASAGFRSVPEDFVVNEDLGFDLTGTGQHVCLHIEKHEQNTVWVARQLAEQTGIKLMDVGYCGLKDRHAVTRQWFSITTGANKVLDPAGLAIEGVKVLECIKHDRKLRPGMHQGNQFVIRLRNVTGDIATLTDRFNDVCQQGVPNYFGEQRFGRAGGNLAMAVELQGKHPSVWRQRQYQFALSAIRSWLFNSVLATRVQNGSWRDCIEGDPEDVSTGPLWGRGRLSSSAQLQEKELEVLAAFPEWCDVLEHIGVKQERRALMLLPENGRQRWEDRDWILEFALPPGTYATSVIRELLRTSIAV